MASDPKAEQRDAIRERRRAIILVGDDVLCRLLELPENLRIIGIKADWERIGVQLMVEGDALDVVHPGMEPPRMPGRWEFVGEERRPRYVPEMPAGDTEPTAPGVTDGQ